jgi:hypothetical protein
MSTERLGIDLDERPFYGEQGPSAYRWLGLCRIRLRRRKEGRACASASHAA